MRLVKKFRCIVWFEWAGPPTARKSADRNNQRGPLQIKYFRLIKNLYWQQTASAKTDDGFTASFPIKRGVRQGCVLSPPLFNVYTDHIFRNVEDMPE